MTHIVLATLSAKSKVFLFTLILIIPLVSDISSMVIFEPGIILFLCKKSTNSEFSGGILDSIYVLFMDVSESGIIFSALSF